MRLFLLLNSFLALLSHAATENEKLAQDLLSSKDKLLAEARQLEGLAILLLKQNEEQAQVKALKESLVGLPIGAYLTVPRANRHTSSQSSQGETISDTERLRMSEILKSVERKLAGTMMLRSRNGNTAAPAQDSNDISVPVKRQAVNTNDDVRDQPKRKRVALSDLSNAVSNNLLIDSSKKSADKEQQQKRRGAAKTLEVKVDETQSPSEEQSHMSNKKRFSKLREPLSDVNVSDESVVLIEDNVAEEMEVECPEYDFDAECAGDPYAVSMYAFDIFKYYVSREPKFRVGDYLKVQPQLTKEMRAVLADWMVEVQECFELNHETLYMAMKLTDLYLDRVPNVGRDDLQLIASTALFVAAKFDERSPPLIDDFMFICEDSFTREALIRMEHKMLKVIRFDLGCPLSYRFLRRYARVCKTDMGTLTLARYILETSLMFYEFVPVSDSLMGAACFLMAIRMKKLGDWNPVLVKYTGYRLGEVEPLMWRLNHMMVMRPKVYDRLVTAYNKYRHEVFFRSAAVPLLDDVFPTSEPVGPPPHLGFSSF